MVDFADVVWWCGGLCWWCWCGGWVVWCGVLYVLVMYGDVVLWVMVWCGRVVVV